MAFFVYIFASFVYQYVDCSVIFLNSDSLLSLSL